MDNRSHTEKKLMDYINDSLNKDSNFNVVINIQNSSSQNPGACFGCGGKDGYGGSIEDFAKNNPNLNISIQHGAKD
ncbi:hypothetical protein [Psychrobacter sp. I-STPA10]|uniref:hypothetical protein n=1 Tax=Psychrobacter sp. I-STPA10 TaxID=2585769 RepID=UPI001E5FF808|nr:hypothetical protein [Psychrobacter sp. I-STPA10]